MASSNHTLSNKNKDLIVELIDNESHNATERYKFVLHNVLEEKNISEAIIEGSKLAILNLLSVLKTNLPYIISYKRI